MVPNEKETLENLDSNEDNLSHISSEPPELDSEVASLLGNLSDDSYQDPDYDIESFESSSSVQKVLTIIAFTSYNILI